MSLRLSVCLFPCLFFYWSTALLLWKVYPCLSIFFVISATAMYSKYELLPLSKENKGKSCVLGCKITLYIDDCAEKMMKKNLKGTNGPNLLV